jgi:hypothetical protein
MGWPPLGAAIAMDLGMVRHGVLLSGSNMGSGGIAPTAKWMVFAWREGPGSHPVAGAVIIRQKGGSRWAGGAHPRGLMPCLNRVHLPIHEQYSTKAGSHYFLPRLFGFNYVSCLAVFELSVSARCPRQHL